MHCVFFVSAQCSFFCLLLHLMMKENNWLLCLHYCYSFDCLHCVQHLSQHPCFLQLFSATCISCVMLDSLVLPLFVLPSATSACRESMFMLINLSAAVSGIASSAYPFLGTTRNTHLFLIFLNLITTTHVPNCVMFVLLYVLSLIWPFMLLFR